MEIGGLERIRTPDPLIRSQVLYPTELPVRKVWGDVDPAFGLCKTEMSFRSGAEESVGFGQANRKGGAFGV